MMKAKKVRLLNKAEVIRTAWNGFYEGISKGAVPNIVFNVLLLIGYIVSAVNSAEIPPMETAAEIAVCFAAIGMNIYVKIMTSGRTCKFGRKIDDAYEYPMLGDVKRLGGNICFGASFVVAAVITVSINATICIVCPMAEEPYQAIIPVLICGILYKLSYLFVLDTSVKEESQLEHETH